MTGEELLNCYYADIQSCEPNSLVDLKQVEINTKLPVRDRMEQYMEQIKNPYLFRVDTMIVKVTFSGNRDLSSALAGLMQN